MAKNDQIETLENFADRMEQTYPASQIREVTARRKAYSEMIANAPGMAERVEKFSEYSLPDFWWKERDMNMLQVLRKDFLVAATLLPLISQSIGDEKKVYEYNRVGDSGDTTISTTYGQTDHNYDSTQGSLAAAPLAILETPFVMTYEDFLADSRSGGGQLRSASEANAIDKHWRKWEDIFMNGTNEVTIDGQGISGIRSTGTNRKRAQTNGTLRGGTGATWEGNFRTLQEMFTAQGHNPMGNGSGLFVLFVNALDWEWAMLKEWSAEYPMKISEMFEKYRGILRIVPTHSVPANEMWAVIPDRKWVRAPMAAMPMTTELDMVMPKDKHKFLIQSKGTFVVLEDENGATGVGGLHA